MANGHGGYRRPNSPAPVSGPGQLSKRTDGGPVDGQPVQDVGGFEYGGRKEFREIQGAAPMNESGVAPTPVDFTPLQAASMRPDEPVTAGAALGPGEGPLPVVQQNRVGDLIAHLSQYDGSGELQYLANILQAKGL